jgi:hypothetical protein
MARGLLRGGQASWLSFVFVWRYRRAGFWRILCSLIGFFLLSLCLLVSLFLYSVTLLSFFLFFINFGTLGHLEDLFGLGMMEVLAIIKRMVSTSDFPFPLPALLFCLSAYILLFSLPFFNFFSFFLPLQEQKVAMDTPSQLSKKLNPLAPEQRNRLR